MTTPPQQANLGMRHNYFNGGIMPIIDFNQCWTTKDEIKFLNYMASEDSRGENRGAPSIAQRKEKIKSWMINKDSRKWVGSVDVKKCNDHAIMLLVSLAMHGKR